jgi:cysteine desulfurase/selenocysteine lyase
MVAMLAPKSDFIGLDGITHLATGGEPPLLKAHRDAFELYANDKARGFPGYYDHWAVAQEVRGQLAVMTNLAADDFALLGNASTGINSVLSSIDWQAGDNVVSATLEYASGRYAFARLESLGVDTRLVEPYGWLIDIDDLINACDKRTRMVYVSQVSYLTGQALDIAALSAALRKRAIPLLVDVSHALGVVPVDGRFTDFMVSAGYKWLLGTHTGILAWNKSAWPDFNPLHIGWSSAAPGPTPSSFALKQTAARAEAGNPNHLDTYLMRTSLNYLADIGVERIAAHARELGGALRRDLIRLGLSVTTPEAPEARAGNICFTHPNADQLMALAAEDNILIWSDSGRVRLSVHVFVDTADITHFLNKLPEYLAKTG